LGQGLSSATRICGLPDSVALNLPEDDGDSQGSEQAHQPEEEDAGVAVKADDRAGQGAGQEEGDISEGGVDAQGGAAIVEGDALDRFHAEGGKDQRKTGSGERHSSSIPRDSNERQVMATG
jgi:hypothetical protein